MTAHTYASDEIYTAMVTASNSTNAVSAATSVTVTPASVLTTRTITYTYDGLSRLTDATYRSASLTAGSTGDAYAYEYDAGDRVVMTDTSGTTTHTYDAANRLTHV